MNDIDTSTQSGNNGKKNNIMDSFDAIVKQKEDCSISQLWNYPKSLEHQRITIQNQLHQIQATHFHELIQNSQLSLKNSPHVDGLSKVNHNVISNILPSIKKSVSVLQGYQNEWKKSKDRNRQCLKHFDEIKALVELPVLLNDCVQEELFSEALDLDQYARNLKHSFPGIPLFQEMVEKTHESVGFMLRALNFSLKKKNLSVPQSLRLVTLLKRLNVCTQTELRTLFLHHRMAYVMFQLKETSSSENSFVHLCNLAKSLKDSLFPVITQYKNMFPDRGIIEDNLILISCIERYVTSTFVSIFQDKIRNIRDAEKLSKLAEECNYCSQTLMKVGCDLRGLLGNLIIGRMGSHIEELTSKIIPVFQNSIHSFSWKTQPNVTHYHLKDIEMQLIKYSPISKLTNDFLRVLNEIQHFPVMQLKNKILFSNFVPIFQAVQTEISKIEESYPFDQNEKVNFEEFVKISRHHLPLHLINCYSTIFDISIDTKQKFFTCVHFNEGQFSIHDTEEVIDKEMNEEKQNEMNEEKQNDDKGSELAVEKSPEENVKTKENLAET